MNEFKTYHPIVNFIYFVFVIGFSCFFMHPICLAISFVSGFVYSVMLKGIESVKKNLMFIIPVMVMTALLNPVFNHEGITIITYLPGGNPLTLESVLYGIGAAAMLVSIIFHFSCYNEVMTSDKFIYLFGKIIPSMSLIISMTLRFVPRFTSELKVVVRAQRGLGRDVRCGSIIKRAKNGITILSIMVSWALENAIETADSMKSRGYGCPGRTAFSIFTFGRRDRSVLCVIIIAGLYTISGAMMGAVDFSYFPYMSAIDISVYDMSVLGTYAVVCVCPIVIEVWEVRRWNALRSKI